MATCIWTPGPVWSYTILDLPTASDHNSSWRHGPDYDGLDPARIIVPTAMELHLLHLRIVTRQLCGRIPLLFRRTRTANAVTPREQNLSALLLVPSGNMVDPPEFPRLPLNRGGLGRGDCYGLFSIQEANGLRAQCGKVLSESRYGRARG